jgi:hypothetical protein
VVAVTAPATATVTEELRLLDRLARTLPPDVVARVEAFDPGRRGVWWGSPFLTSDEPVLGREVVHGRPRAFLALEDKLLAERVWAAVGAARAPHEVVDAGDLPGLRAAAAGLAGPLGTVWSGDARDGFNGGGDLVRWVVDDDEALAAAAWFAPRCDQVRVQPFLDGVPCSIHGFVLPDGTAVFRPVEIAMLRSTSTPRRFVYGGLGTFWDPPAVDREVMRALARAVGEHLRAEHAYAGAFGVDGVLTAEGFRPTELNPRFSGGLTTLVRPVDPWFATLLQSAATGGWEHDVTTAELESLVELMDAARTGKVAVMGRCTGLEPVSRALAWDGARFTLSDDEPLPERADVLALGPTPSGFFARVDRCSALSRPGDRVADANAALVDLLDRELGTDVGPVVAPPDVRRGP